MNALAWPFAAWISTEEGKGEEQEEEDNAEEKDSLPALSLYLQFRGVRSLRSRGEGRSLLAVSAVSSQKAEGLVLLRESLGFLLAGSEVGRESLVVASECLRGAVQRRPHSLGVLELELGDRVLDLDGEAVQEVAGLLQVLPVRVVLLDGGGRLRDGREEVRVGAEKGGRHLCRVGD